MGEWFGVAIALVSSSIGGTAAAITRYLVGGADPILLAILRWGIGFLCLLPCALVLRVRWPPRADWPSVALLGICFFGLFFILYNIAVSYTTAPAPAWRWRRCRSTPWWSVRSWAWSG
ncbi:DMT family transporter [Bradyrhizobium sp. SEMIA]|uniref:DMT family transporter n=1 Tax=Bradyrhizobium sp. SEMIA TaxID=2597515 RepID=UPI0022409FAE|nr:DMT family transporter [Bradyrhizobium sp. SEMIA]